MKQPIGFEYFHLTYCIIDNKEGQYWKDIYVVDHDVCLL